MLGNIERLLFEIAHYLKQLAAAATPAGVSLTAPPGGDTGVTSPVPPPVTINSPGAADAQGSDVGGTGDAGSLSAGNLAADPGTASTNPAPVAGP